MSLQINSRRSDFVKCSLKHFGSFSSGIWFLHILLCTDKFGVLLRQVLCENGLKSRSTWTNFRSPVSLYHYLIFYRGDLTFEIMAFTLEGKND